MPLHPAGRSLAFCQDGVFLNKLLGNVRKGRLGLDFLCRGGQDADRGLPVEAQIPFLSYLDGFLEGFFLRAVAVVVAVYKGRCLPIRAALAAEDIRSAAE